MALTRRTAVLESFRRDVRSYNRRFLPQTSPDRWPVMHARSSRYCRSGRVHGAKRPMDPGRRGLRPRVQHILASLVLTNRKIPSPDSTGKGIVAVWFSLVPRFAAQRLFTRVGIIRPSADHVGWQQMRPYHGERSVNTGRERTRQGARMRFR